VFKYSLHSKFKCNKLTKKRIYIKFHTFWGRHPDAFTSISGQWFVNEMNFFIRVEPRIRLQMDYQPEKPRYNVLVVRVYSTSQEQLGL